MSLAGQHVGTDICTNIRTHISTDISVPRNAVIGHTPKYGVPPTQHPVDSAFPRIAPRVRSFPHASHGVGMSSSKIYPNAAEALRGLVADGQTLAVGGFGLCGIPEALIAALRDSGVTGLTAISNNAGVDGFGLGMLLATRQIKRMISSYVGENKEFERQYLSGELELEFNPQGTLAERLRAGGAGIPAFYVRTGYGTVVAEGKETRQFDDGHWYVMETALKADVSLVKAWKADTSGNLVFRKTGRNFNPACAMAGKVCIVEVEQLVDVGEIDPDHVHLPGIYVDRIVVNATPEKRIEQRTVRASSQGDK